MNTAAAKEIARDAIGADPVIAVTSDAFGLVIEAQDIDLHTLRGFVGSAIFDSRSHLATGPVSSIEEESDRITIRFPYGDADNYSNTEQWEYFDKIREILMGRLGTHFSVAQRIEAWLGQVVAIRMQELPLGRVAIN